MLNDNLINVFKELNDPNNPKKMKWLKPDAQVSLLSANFRCNPLIRHIPILSANPGELKALISRVDFEAFVTPPVNNLHNLDLISGDTQDAIAAFIKEVGKQKIQDAFSKFFEGETKQLSSTQDTVRVAIEGLTKLQIVDEKNNVSRRYRTLPVFNDQSLLVGMLSYTNVLRKIKETEGCAAFLEKQIQDIYTKKDKLKTLNGDDKFLEAAMLLDGAPFTHIPIMKPIMKPGDEDKGRIVTGIVDDLIIARYQHDLLLNDLADKPLEKFQTWVDNDNIVGPQQTVRDVIDKLLTITYPDRPTAILVCTTNSNGFVLQGIVSYADILKGFVKWWDHKNPANNPVPPGGN